MFVSAGSSGKRGSGERWVSESKQKRELLVCHCGVITNIKRTVERTEGGTALLTSMGSGHVAAAHAEEVGKHRFGARHRGERVGDCHRSERVGDCHRGERVGDCHRGERVGLKNGGGAGVSDAAIPTGALADAVVVKGPTFRVVRPGPHLHVTVVGFPRAAGGREREREVGENDVEREREERGWGGG